MVGAGFFLIGLAAWCGALIGPPLLAMWSWLPTTKWPIVTRSLITPGLAGVEWTMLRLVFFAAHDDGEGPPGLGLLLIPPLASFAITIAVHLLAMGWMLSRLVWRALRGR